MKLSEPRSHTQQSRDADRYHRRRRYRCKHGYNATDTDMDIDMDVNTKHFQLVWALLGSQRHRGMGPIKRAA